MRGGCGVRARRIRAGPPRAPVSGLRMHSSWRVEESLDPPYPTEQGGQHGYRSKERWLAFPISFGTRILGSSHDLTAGGVFVFSATSPPSAATQGFLGYGINES